jgi:small subunit ribosomal protein S2
MIEREISRLEKRLSGIRNMKRLPDVLFVVDVMREDTAVHEANLKNIPVVAMVDTNCDPKNVDYIIPSNDDAIRAIKLIVGKIADAVMEGKAIRSKEVEEEELHAAPMPPSMSRFIQDDDELEDEDLLGESTLKYIGSAKRAKYDDLEADLEDDVEDTLEEDLDVEDDARTVEDNDGDSDVDEE